MLYTKKFGLAPGDRIVRPIFATGISKHHAVFLGADHAGTEWVAENYFKEGVRLVNAVDFFSKMKSFNIVKFNGNYQQRVEAVKRALLKLGTPYDLIDYNCEHFATYVQTGKAFSKQVEIVNDLLKVVTVCGFAALVVNLISKN